MASAGAKARKLKRHLSDGGATKPSYSQVLKQDLTGNYINKSLNFTDISTELYDERKHVRSEVLSELNVLLKSNYERESARKERVVVTS